MSADFGKLILIIGDLHVPDRQSLIPPEFEKLLTTDKIEHVLCTGNIGNNTTLTRLKNIANDFHIVHGDMDGSLSSDEFPEHKIIEICDWKIGLLNGYQIMPSGSHEALAAWQRKLNCDILISGHTHVSSAEKIKGKVYVNPGSATGAFSPRSDGASIPSFMLMAIRGLNVILYVYELKDSKVSVSMSQFSK